MEDGNEGVRQLDVAAANELAQEINDRARGAPHVATDDSYPNERRGSSESNATAEPSPAEATAGDKPLESQEIEGAKGVFPPDIVPSVELGGSPEEQGVLRDEYRRG